LANETEEVGEAFLFNRWSYHFKEAKSGGHCQPVDRLVQRLHGVPYSVHEGISPNLYKNHRFPAEIISRAVWLYFRFGFSYRNVVELLFARGVIATYGAMPKWCVMFGQQYAKQLRRRPPTDQGTRGISMRFF
jgi:hypothetical protein